jgi:hypothetical protein
VPFVVRVFGDQAAAGAGDAALDHQIVECSISNLSVSRKPPSFSVAAGPTYASVRSRNAVAVVA